MEFQIAEAIELIKTLAETENLTKTQALTAFVAEAGLDIEYASKLKAALFEEYTLQEMASDSMTKALYSVFVAGETGTEDIQEVDTKETQEGTKYKVRVKDKASGSSYVRYATREKVAELRANPNIASVEMTDYGSTGEDDRGERTAAAKGGGKDHDGDGKVESSSKEHAGVVHNAIQRKMGGRPDGQDTRKEEVEIEEAIDAKGARRKDDAKGKKKETQDEINKRLMLGKYSPAVKYGKKVEEGMHRDAETGEVVDKAEVGKTYYPNMPKQKSSVALRKEKEAAEKKKTKKESAWDAYLELREGKKKELAEAKAKTREEARAKLEANKKAIESGKPEESPYGAHLRKDPMSTHPSDAKAHKKEDQKEGYVVEADLVDSGRENQSQRDRKKLDGKNVDNSRNVVLMPSIGEALQTETETPKSADRLLEAKKNEELRSKIKEVAMKEECCDKCGTPECTCESKKEEKPREKKAKLDEAGMPILEYSRNNATGPTKDMIDPPKDPEGEPGVKNPKGKPKRPQGGDRRPNNGGPDLPNEKGTVPTGAGV